MYQLADGDRRAARDAQSERAGFMLVKRQSPWIYGLAPIHACESRFYLARGAGGLVAVVAVLVAIAIPASTRMSQYTARMKSISNLRQIGVAAHLYANDHDQQLPGQPPAARTAADTPRPGPVAHAVLRLPLARATRACSSTRSDPSTAKLPLPQVISNTANNTGFVYNGFDDLARRTTSRRPACPLTRLDTPVARWCCSRRSPRGAKAFYVDLLFNPLGSLFTLLNPQAYDGGSHYLFVDGSVRFIKQTDYNNNLWLVNKTIAAAAAAAAAAAGLPVRRSDLRRV